MDPSARFRSSNNGQYNAVQDLRADIAEASVNAELARRRSNQMRGSAEFWERKVRLLEQELRVMQEEDQLSFSLGARPGALGQVGVQST